MTLEELDNLIIESRDFDVNQMNVGRGNIDNGLALPYNGESYFGLTYSGGEIKSVDDFTKKPRYAAYGFKARI